MFSQSNSRTEKWKEGITNYRVIILLILTIIVSLTSAGLSYYENQALIGGVKVSIIALTNLLTATLDFLFGAAIVIEISNRHNLYSFIWKIPEWITPEDILRKKRGTVEEGFIKEVYFEDRKEEVTFRKKMQELLSKEKKELIPEQMNILLIGDTSCGKSRMIYQWLKDKQTQRKVSVCMLRADFELPKERMRLVPWHWRWWRKRLLLLDDLNSLVTRLGFDELIKQWRKKNVIIIATCTTEEHYRIIEEKADFGVIKLKEFLQIKFTPLRKVIDEKRKRKSNPDYLKFMEYLLANKEVLEEKLGETLEKRLVNFDSNIGSFFINLAVKKKRFIDLCDEDKSIIALSQTIKTLFTYSLYVGAGLFYKEDVEALFRIDYPSMEPGEFKTKFVMLLKKALIYLNDEIKIGVEQAYILKFFEPKTDEKTFLNQMMRVETANLLAKVFKLKPEYMKRIGVIIAIRLELLTEQKHELAKIALNCLEQIKGRIGDESERLFYIANIHLKLDDYQKAINNYQQIIEKESNYPAVWNNMGLAYFEKGEFGQAIKHYKKAVELKPDYHEAWHNMGVAYDYKGEFDQAIKPYKKAVELKPDIHEAWNNMGCAYDYKGEFDQAIKYFKKAVKIKPDYHDAWYNMGLAYFDKDEFGEAIKYFKKAVKIKPDDHEAWNNMGAAYFKKDEFGEAFDCYKKALTIKKDFKEALGNLIIFYSKIKEYKKALAKGEEYRTKWPDRWEGYFLSAGALTLQLGEQELSGQTKAKKKKEALELLEEAIKLNAECKDMARKDPDFDSLRDDDDFKELVGQS